MPRIAAIVLTVGLAGTVGWAEILEQILVKVNGEILTKTDLELRQLQAVQQLADFDPALASEADLNQAIGRVTPGLLADAVDEMLLIQRGRELGVALTDEQFDRMLDSIRTENNLEDEAEFEAALTQQGLTRGDLRTLLERQTIVSRVQQLEVAPRVDITDQEARAYFDQHQADFVTSPGIMLREILLKVPETEDGGISVGVDEETKATAEDLRQRAARGEDFAALASERSESASRANGGLIGPIDQEDLAPQFREMIDPLRPGQVTPVVRTTQGYQFFKLESRSESGQLTFEQARTQVTELIGNEKLRVERRRYIEMLRNGAIITWNNDELKKAYEQGLAERAASS